MREPVQRQPNEIGWWLASDGMWYPPERPAGQPPIPGSRQRFLDPAGKPSAVVFAFVAAAAVVASRIGLPWDMSTVDARGELRQNVESVSWQQVVIAVLVLAGAVLIATLVRPRAWRWIAVAGTATVEVWFLWRGLSARVIGANFAFLGPLWLLPIPLVVTFLPAWFASRHRADPSRMGQHASG